MIVSLLKAASNVPLSVAVLVFGVFVVAAAAAPGTILRTEILKDKVVSIALYVSNDRAIDFLSRDIACCVLTVLVLVLHQQTDDFGNFENRDKSSYPIHG